jgi:hypothetical protein
MGIDLDESVSVARVNPFLKRDEAVASKYSTNTIATCIIFNVEKRLVCYSVFICRDPMITDGDTSFLVYPS